MNINIDNLMFALAVTGFLIVTAFAIYRSVKADEKKGLVLSSWWRKISDLFWAM